MSEQKIEEIKYILYTVIFNTNEQIIFDLINSAILVLMELESELENEK